MKILTALLTLLSIPAWAGSSLSTVTVSQSLSMTSPSAIISMTGVSATAYLKNISTTNISSTNSQITSATVGTISGTGAYGASVVFNGRGSPTTIIRQYNVSSVLKNGTGNYSIVGTFPNNPIGACMAAKGADTTAGVLINTSPTTVSFSIITYNTATGAPEDKNYVTCTIY